MTDIKSTWNNVTPNKVKIAYQLARSKGMSVRAALRFVKRKLKIDNDK